jgi:hypothetical protein
MPAQPVDATPSGINLFSKGGVYVRKETCSDFRRRVVGQFSVTPIGLLNNDHVESPTMCISDQPIQLLQGAAENVAFSNNLGADPDETQHR